MIPFDPAPMISYLRSIVNMGLSRINGDFSRKSHLFPPLYILRPRWRGSRWNCISAQGIKKLEWWATRWA